LAENANQHYVPQFYFRHFSVDPKRIAVLLIADGQVVLNAAIRGQCSKKNFYGPPEVEKALSAAEAEYCQGVRAALDVANSSSAPFFSPREYVLLLEGIVFQRARTAAEARRHAQSMEEMQLFMFRRFIEEQDDIERRQEMLDAIDRGEISITEPTSVTAAKCITESLPLARLIRDLSLCLVRNRTDYPFIFSDAPVVFYNKYCEKVRSRGVLGLQCPGLLIFYPLDQWTCAILYDSDKYHGAFRGYVQYDAHQRADISEINKLQIYSAQKAVYFGNPLHEDYVHDLWRAHRPLLAKPESSCRINPNLWIDGKPVEGDLIQLMDPQLNTTLNLSFLECHQVSQADYKYKPRDPELHASVRDGRSGEEE
jgi:hypothetical protein